MKVYEIGDQIEFTTNQGQQTATVTGRNWCFSDLVSYVVKYQGGDMPVCAKTLKAQLIT